MNVIENRLFYKYINIVIITYDICVSASEILCHVQPLPGQSIAE